MTERSKFWNGTTVGDAATEAPYDAPTEFSRVVESVGNAIKQLDTNRGGIFQDALNELAATGAVSPVAINTGRALNTGTWYENDASLNVVVATPAGATRIDRIVLRKSWAAQTIRITSIAGVEGGGAPALVQVYGTTWDVPLVQASITTGGAITLTDQREFLAAVAVDVQLFPSSNTWTRPTGASATSRTLVRTKGAAGGGGGGATLGDAGYGGGAGAGGGYVEKLVPTLSLGATESVTIGAGGTGGVGVTGASVSGNPGTAGGNTTFGAHLTAYGGGRGDGGGDTTTDAGPSGQGGGGGGSGSAGGVGTRGSISVGGNPQITGVTQGNTSGNSGAGRPVSGATGCAELGGGAGGGTGGAAGGSSLKGGAGGGQGGPSNGGGVGGAGGTSNSYVVGGGGAGGAGSGAGAGSPGVAGTSATDITGGSAGGGGGGSNAGGNGGVGGAGGNYGHGGGGGGGSAAANTTGAGGVGAGGYCEVITFI